MASLAVLAQDNPPGENPYKGIARRNAFGLREPAPPPPPPTNPPAPPPDKVDVKLAGVSQIGALRYAHLMLPDKDRPGQFLYPTLTDNPAHGNTRNSAVEVVEIDAVRETVRIRNAGFEMTLSFAENGIKGAAPAAVPGKPGVPAPGQPGVRAGLPGAAPAQPGLNPNAGPVVFSSRAGVASDGTPQPSPTAAAINQLNSLAVQPDIGAQNVSRPLRTRGGVAEQPMGNAFNSGNPAQDQINAVTEQRRRGAELGIELPPFPGSPQ
ncbi:MAG: hypothetical protein ACKVYV_10975 [Limisphaerales bacterium]